VPGTRHTAERITTLVCTAKRGPRSSATREGGRPPKTTSSSGSHIAIWRWPRLDAAAIAGRTGSGVARAVTSRSQCLRGSVGFSVRTVAEPLHFGRAENSSGLLGFPRGRRAWFVRGGAWRLRDRWSPSYAPLGVACGDRRRFWARARPSGAGRAAGSSQPGVLFGYSARSAFPASPGRAKHHPSRRLRPRRFVSLCCCSVASWLWRNGPVAAPYCGRSLRDRMGRDSR